MLLAKPTAAPGRRPNPTRCCWRPGCHFTVNSAASERSVSSRQVQRHAAQLQQHRWATHDHAQAGVVAGQRALPCMAAAVRLCTSRPAAGRRAAVCRGAWGMGRTQRCRGSWRRGIQGQLSGRAVGAGCWRRTGACTGTGSMARAPPWWRITAAAAFIRRAWCWNREGRARQCCRRCCWCAPIGKQKLHECCTVRRLCAHTRQPSCTGCAEQLCWASVWRTTVCVMKAWWSVAVNHRAR